MIGEKQFCYFEMEKKEAVPEIDVLKKKWDRYTPYFHETISRVLDSGC